MGGERGGARGPGGGLRQAGAREGGRAAGGSAHTWRAAQPVHMRGAEAVCVKPQRGRHVLGLARREPHLLAQHPLPPLPLPTQDEPARGHASPVAASV